MIHIDMERYSIKKSIQESFREVFLMRKKKMSKKTWEEYMNERRKNNE